jgi:CelD/BcsL family acetyltransferase involved in cellulose biosynthesis
MTAWEALAGLEPIAGHTGPFPLPGFLGAWWRHHGRGTLLPVGAGGGALVLTIADGTARLAGEADLTDYHSPLGTDLEGTAAAAAAALPAGTRLSLDSLPLEAAEPLMKQFAAAGVSLSMRAHDATMVLDLPRDPEEYLAALDSKQRHEVRRKRRRFEEQAGAPSLHREPAALADFAAMHRTAAGAKGTFMTPEMEGFFASLLDEAGAVIDVLRNGDGVAVGAAFGFEDDNTYYLYNSAFDQGRAGLSPGIVLVTSLIDAAISTGKRRFDFLKGGEDYKVRLGAIPRTLFVLEGES